jgi:hypothetical protein
MKTAKVAAALALASVSAPALAGPPFATNDPAPTDFGHWETYAFTTSAWRAGTFDGQAGIELNYGVIRDIQLTASLPLEFSHSAEEGWRAGTGDVEVGVKYRFLHDERSGFSAALFPKAALPTSSSAAHERARFLLPVWAQKDIGRWSVFGGGGYAVNPGSGNRDYWTGGVAVTRELGARLLIGAELDRQGPDTAGSRASTSVGLGAIVDLKGPLRLLASGGPTWTDGGRSGFHAYAALGLDF